MNRLQGHDESYFLLDQVEGHVSVYCLYWTEMAAGCTMPTRQTGSVTSNVGSWNSCDVTVTCITYLKIVVDCIHSKSCLTNSTSTQNATTILIKSHSIKRFQNQA